MAYDEAFKNAGRKPGIEIWRIKEFKVIPLDKSEYGQFYQGDSYIVLRSIEVQKKLCHDVHFWMGDGTSQDEYGTAAIKTVELDESLGGLPVQHREVQDHESSLFLSYFKKGIKYLLGGFESGFHHVGDEKFEPRLLQCKGKRNVRVRQVELKMESLNRGDVFILDTGEDVFVWMPPKAGRLERIKGVHHANNIRDQEHSGRGDVIVCDQDWDSNAEFWAIVGGGAGDVAEEVPDEGANNSLQISDDMPPVTLHKISDASGRMRVEKAGESALKFDMLDSSDAFILDSASGGLFVWVGKKCTLNERKKAMTYASAYLEGEGRPPWSQVTRVLETAEPAIFTQWFTDDAPSKKNVAFKPKLFECSDESGAVTVEEVADFDQEDLDGDDVMILDSGAVVYVWMGSGASESEMIHANDIAQRYLKSDAMPRPKDAEVMVIAQGSEPANFTKHFKLWNPDANAFAGRTVEGASRK